MRAHALRNGLRVGLLATSFWLATGSLALGDPAAEFKQAKEAYAQAIAAEKATAERVKAAEDALKSVEQRVTDVAQAELAKIADIERRKRAAERELMALMERRSGVELEVARARDLAAEARRAYDQARPIYLLIGRTQQLSDYPEWKAIERRASETHAANQKAYKDSRPIVEQLDREIEAKRQVVLAIDREFGKPVTAPDDKLTGQWLEAAVNAAKLRKEAEQSERNLAAAFDRYAAKLALARPPFLEAVTVDADSLPLYRATWTEQRDSDQNAQSRVEELRKVRDDLAAAISEIEQTREETRAKRLEMAEAMQPKTKAFVEAEAERYDAQIKKIGFAALAEIGGTIVEVALTGGVATAIRKGEELAEAKVAEAAAQKLLRNSAPLTEEATDLTARLAQRSERAFAREVRTAYAEAQRIAAENAARRVQRTGEALDVITIDAKRNLDRALRGLQDTDPEIRALAEKEARALLGERWKTILEPILQAAVGKPGSGYLADLIHGGSPSADPISRLTAPNKEASATNVTQDVKSVVMGDVYEQGIARGLSYAISVAPDAGRAGLDALRAAGAANVSRWRQVASGSRAFLRGGASLPKLKEALGGTAKGNLIAVATTGAKALITAYYGSKEQAAGQRAFELYAELTVDYALYYKALEADRTLFDTLSETRRLYSEIATYLALLGQPRKLDITDDSADRSSGSNSQLAIRLRFNVPISRAPVATLGGVRLDLQAAERDASGAAVWDASIARNRLPADAVAVPLVVTLADDTEPFGTLDSDPATSARPDPRIPPTGTPGKASVSWIGLQPGNDRNHTVSLADPWTGIWVRGQTRIRIARDGDWLTGRIETAGEPGKSDRGFSEGEEVMRGDISPHRTASLQLRARYARAWRDKCPQASDGYWGRGSYVLDAAGTLTGQWENRQLDESCKVTETIMQTDTLHRAPPR